MIVKIHFFEVKILMELSLILVCKSHQIYLLLFVTVGGKKNVLLLNPQVDQPSMMNPQWFSITSSSLPHSPQGSLTSNRPPLSLRHCASKASVDACAAAQALSGSPWQLWAAWGSAGRDVARGHPWQGVHKWGDPLVICCIASENTPCIVDLPSQNGDCP